MSLAASMRGPGGRGAGAGNIGSAKGRAGPLSAPAARMRQRAAFFSSTPPSVSPSLTPPGGSISPSKRRSPSSLLPGTGGAEDISVSVLGGVRDVVLGAFLGHGNLEPVIPLPAAAAIDAPATAAAGSGRGGSDGGGLRTVASGLGDAEPSLASRAAAAAATSRWKWGGTTGGDDSGGGDGRGGAGQNGSGCDDESPAEPRDTAVVEAFVLNGTMQPNPLYNRGAPPPTTGPRPPLRSALKSSSTNNALSPTTDRLTSVSVALSNRRSDGGGDDTVVDNGSSSRNDTGSGDGTGEIDIAGGDGGDDCGGGGADDASSDRSGRSGSGATTVSFEERTERGAAKGGRTGGRSLSFASRLRVSATGSASSSPPRHSARRKAENNHKFSWLVRSSLGGRDKVTRQKGRREGSTDMNTADAADSVAAAQKAEEDPTADDEEEKKVAADAHIAADVSVALRRGWSHGHAQATPSVAHDSNPDRGKKMDPPPAASAVAGAVAASPARGPAAAARPGGAAGGGRMLGGWRWNIPSPATRWGASKSSSDATKDGRNGAGGGGGGGDDDVTRLSISTRSTSEGTPRHALQTPGVTPSARGIGWGSLARGTAVGGGGGGGSAAFFPLDQTTPNTPFTGGPPSAAPATSEWGTGPPTFGSSGAFGGFGGEPGSRNSRGRDAAPWMHHVYDGRGPSPPPRSASPLPSAAPGRRKRSLSLSATSSDRLVWEAGLVAPFEDSSTFHMSSLPFHSVSSLPSS
ncbi:unnamed protein product, partial [Phaeothamnion confervicola]